MHIIAAMFLWVMTGIDIGLLGLGESIPDEYIVKPMFILRKRAEVV
jgi:hypothetical protein